MIRASLLAALALVPALLAGRIVAQSAPTPHASPAAPLAIGETFTIDSQILGETRRINVYRAPAPGESTATARPLLVMPDGGLGEDFLHVAGLLEVSIGNGTMRPFLLVGIENTQRRRDLTGPTTNPEDRKIAPHVGGSAAFRRFIREELLPVIRARYAVTDERAIMGESLAGLFVVETLVREPDLFDTYVAFDPSLWWSDSVLVDRTPLPSFAGRPRPVTLYLANSSEPTIARQTAEFAERLRRTPPPGLTWTCTPLPAETHATIYHPAALLAVRKVFAPANPAR